MCRLAVGLDDVEAGDLSLQGTCDIGIGTVFKYFSRNILHAAYELGFLECAVTYYDRLFQHLGVYLEREVDG